MLLATDLDGTFLGGNHSQKEALYQFIRERKNLRLVYVTGRGLQSVIPVLNDPTVPNPDYIICDVGATVVDGHNLKPIEPIQSEIEKKWPGRLRITSLLEKIPGLIYQDVPQQRRCSFITHDESVVEIVREKVKHLRCEVIYSANKFVDVMPHAVNKGSTLCSLVGLLEMDGSRVLVAGDTFNDYTMYTCGFKGVVVGESEQRLTEATKGIELVYHANAAGAGGILEAISEIPDFRHIVNKTTRA